MGCHCQTQSPSPVEYASVFEYDFSSRQNNVNLLKIIPDLIVINESDIGPSPCDTEFVVHSLAKILKMVPLLQLASLTYANLKTTLQHRCQIFKSQSHRFGVRVDHYSF